MAPGYVYRNTDTEIKKQIMNTYILHLSRKYANMRLSPVKIICTYIPADHTRERISNHFGGKLIDN